jgi:MarR family transcriptional regulator, transcriptional regulator for hemolysin
MLANNQLAIYSGTMTGKSDISSISWLLADASRLIRKLADRRLGAIGLTRAQWQALGNLRRMGPMTQAALAEIMEVETATIARLIDRLEAAGWIARKAEAQDRRVKLVTMTDKATAIMDEVGVIGQKLRDDMLVDLSPSELEALIGTLTTIKARGSRVWETR